jgi:putative transcription factor
MAPCELCGREAPLLTTLVEGTELRVCQACGKYGKALKPLSRSPGTAAKAAAVKPRIMEVEYIVSDFGSRIRNARERRGLSQKDFARLLAEKESIVSKLEAGAFEPSVALARKLEHLLGLVLVEKRQAEVGAEAPKPGKDDALTIGDIIRVKTRQP